MSDPTIEEVAKGDPHLEASPNAVYRCGVRDALRAVLREIERLGGNDPFRQSLAVLDIRDRIRAAVGDNVDD